MLFLQIGQGTYSSVYRARDVVSNKIVALKRVRFDNLDPESVRFMCREIIILRNLDHQNIIKLEGLITSHLSCSLYLVFEYMEHDLTGLAARPGVKFTEPQVLVRRSSFIIFCKEHPTNVWVPMLVSIYLYSNIQIFKLMPV